MEWERNLAVSGVVGFIISKRENGKMENLEPKSENLKLIFLFYTQNSWITNVINFYLFIFFNIKKKILCKRVRCILSTINGPRTRGEKVTFLEFCFRIRNGADKLFASPPEKKVFFSTFWELLESVRLGLLAKKIAIWTNTVVGSLGLQLPRVKAYSKRWEITLSVGALCLSCVADDSSVHVVIVWDKIAKIGFDH